MKRIFELTIMMLIVFSLLLTVALVSAENNSTTNSNYTTQSNMTEPEIVKEQVKCVFVNSNSVQKCYSDNGNFGCSGYGTCIADVKGEKGTKLTWKSSCGGYAYTIIDGDNEYAEFKCLSETEEIEAEEIIGKGFRGLYVQCYDGLVDKSVWDDCVSSEELQRKAKGFCEGHCYEDGSKCGVNSFSVFEECYIEGEVIPPTYEEECKVDSDCPPVLCKKAPCPENKCVKGKCLFVDFEEEITICKNSCPLDSKCYPFGYRKEGNYCSDDGEFNKQLGGEEFCENNFECESNVCVDGECISGSLLRKIIDWFKNLFS